MAFLNYRKRRGELVMGHKECVGTTLLLSLRNESQDSCKVRLQNRSFS